MARTRANLAALATLRAIQREDRPASPQEQAVLARWSGWGAVPEIFDERRQEYAWAREELSGLLNPAQIAAAARNTLNAHYTDASLVQAIWAGIGQLGFTAGRVLEPGCGSGNFIGFAPDGASITGVELEPVTAQIAAALYPDAEIINESFADTRGREAAFDLAIGNVPFGRAALHDRLYNQGGHSIHNHFIIKSLHLARPGALVAVITSRYTLDSRNPAARREIAALADLAGAVRLPSGAELRFDALYSALGVRIRSGLATALGARADEDGALLVDMHQQTSVAGLYAAGDLVRGLSQVSVAAGEAAIAATAINRSQPFPRYEGSS